MSSVTATSTPARQKYVRAVGPRLRVLLYSIFALFAVLGANSLYLVSITTLEYVTQKIYQDYFYQCMFLLHLVLGLLLILPVVVFGVVHMVTSWNRKNKRAVRIGYGLFVVSLGVLITGILLMRLEGLAELKNATARSTVYWLHLACPLAAIWLYWLHRLAGPKIKWRIGLTYLGIVAGVVALMLVFKAQDPRGYNRRESEEGTKYFEPSLARTSDGKFISKDTLMMDSYCLKCHADAYKGWFHSAHHFSSFNNPAYLASVRETRKVSLERDGDVKAARWCAGCHDPVPFFSGKFDDKNYDDVHDQTSQAGITCTTCHSITHVNSTKGNADYTIEEPIHYPFASSENPILQYINNQLVKAKPSFHKQTFLKPSVHMNAEFCSTCHKVHLPYALNHYKEFLRGQNHYDTYLLSGASGHGAQSFYYPPKAQAKCAGCHMPLAESSDFGAKLFDDTGKPKIHDHFFPGANTAITYYKNMPVDSDHLEAWEKLPEGFKPDYEAALQQNQKFLKEVVRVDIFGIREEGTISGNLIAPLRPQVPTLKPGNKYLLETVIRTLKLGHPLTQGTVDSNEIWMDITVKSGDRIIGRNGAIDEKGEVDRYAHFLNVFMLDRHGNRINRRNPQDIFVPLYNHQVPPGAGQVVHYMLDVPLDLNAPITVEVKLQYRKFDQEYTDYFTKESRHGDRPIRGYTPGQPLVNAIPITTMASDTLTFAVEGVAAEVTNPPSPIKETWQRYNDYGIGLFLEGKKGELRQAEAAFREVEKMGRYDGPLNLARIYELEGRLDEAVEAIRRAAAVEDPAKPTWTMTWLTGNVNRQQGKLEEAIANYRSVLEDKTPLMIERGFDFSFDYRVINDLGITLFERAKQLRGPAQKEVRDQHLQMAVERFQRTLTLDSEDVVAHYNLSLIYALLGNKEKAEVHQRLHARYKLDDNARDAAVAAARIKYPAANLAAEAVIIYPLESLKKEGSASSSPPPSESSIGPPKATSLILPSEDQTSSLFPPRELAD